MIFLKRQHYKKKKRGYASLGLTISLESAHAQELFFSLNEIGADIIC